jgi:hypothetical protein
LEPAPRFERGIASLVTSPDWLLLGIYGYHCLLIGLLAAFALIKYDLHRLPAKLVVAGLALGFVCPAVWPELHPLRWAAPLAPGLERIDTSLVGLLIGGLCGRLLDWQLLAVDRQDPRGKSWSSSAPTLALVGLFLGWQSCTSVLLLSAALALIAATASHAWAWLAKVPLCGLIGLATLVHLACWRQLESWPWWPGDSWPMWQTALAVAAGVVAVHLAARIGRRPEISDYNGGRTAVASQPSESDDIGQLDQDVESASNAPQPPSDDLSSPANESPSS